jgi:hypothetical protein
MLTPIILIGLAVLVFVVVKKKKTKQTVTHKTTASGTGISVGGSTSDNRIVDEPSDSTEKLL